MPVGRSTDPREDDPTVRLVAPLRRLAVPAQVFLLLFGLYAFTVTAVRADRVGQLLVGALLWLGGASQATTLLVRRARGTQRPPIPAGFEADDLAAMRVEGLDRLWRMLAATTVFLLVVGTGYEAAAALAGGRSRAFAIAGAVLLALAVLAGLVSARVRRRHARSTGPRPA